MNKYPFGKYAMSWKERQIKKEMTNDEVGTAVLVVMAAMAGAFMYLLCAIIYTLN